uniref:Pre-mRNA-processing factor 6 n=1 Tax=Bursaphelenchus xylophilus TaxID=6326 RepID=A0A1I7SA43_BURXY
MATTIPGSLVNKTKKHFMGMPAPAGYVAGIGRGATGFTTRSDIGPAKDAGESLPDAPGGPPAKKPKETDDEPEDLNDANFDDFEGYGGSLFSKDPYDKEDEEADEVYYQVDCRQDERRKAYREKKLKEQIDAYRKERPKIQQQFSDLKRQLSAVTEDEWAAIPEVGDSRNKAKRNPRAEKYTAVSDSLIASAMSFGQISSVLDQDVQSGIASTTSGFRSTVGGMKTPGLATPAGTRTSTDLDLQKIGQARKGIMDIRLKGKYSSEIRDQFIERARLGQKPEWLAKAEEEHATQKPAEDSDEEDALQGLFGLQKSASKYIGRPATLPKAYLQSSKLPDPTMANRKEGNKIKVVLFHPTEPVLVTANTSGHVQLYRVARSPTDLQKPTESPFLQEIRVKRFKVSDSVTGQTVVNPQSYLTDLQSINPANGIDVSDVKKARSLFKSIRDSNPNHPPAWIASANLESAVGKMQAARNLIMEGCEKNQDSEELWLTAVRLHPPDQAKLIVSNAVNHLPTSVPIWLAAAGLETELKLKKKVLRKGLARVPKSVKLWKAAIDLETDEEEAKKLLTRAVECCSSSTDLWLALARLETYENARKVLNKARENIPTDRQIWISAAKLEETKGQVEMIEKLMERALISLRANQVEITRKQWFEDAIDAEKSGCPLTANAIIKHVMGVGVEEEDKKTTWLEDAEFFTNQQAFECARSIYGFMLTEFAEKKSVWLEAVVFEKEHGTPESYENLLKKAVEKCPKAEVLWLRYAKARWQQDDVAGARQILSEAFQKNPNSENVWMAAVKLESETNNYEAARKLLTKARTMAPSPRFWLKSARLEWCLEDLAAAEELLKEGIQKYPDFEKFFLMLGQLYEQQKRFDEARKAFTTGTRRCPNSIINWLLLIRFEESQNVAVKARSDLDMARLKNPANELLWLEAIRLEYRAGKKDLAQSILAKALRECENSGILHAEAIYLATKHQRRSVSIQALEKCPESPHVLLAVSKMMWAERKIAKAREWFQRALKMDRDLGDIWAFYYKFEVIQGTSDQQLKVLEDCKLAEPRHGELWQKVSKDIKNWRMTTEQILLTVAASVDIPR